MAILATVHCRFAGNLAGLCGHDRLLRAASMYDYGSRQQRKATDETDHRCTDKDEEKPRAFFGYRWCVFHATKTCSNNKRCVLRLVYLVFTRARPTLKRTLMLLPVMRGKAASSVDRSRAGVASAGAGCERRNAPSAFGEDPIVVRYVGPPHGIRMPKSSAARAASAWRRRSFSRSSSSNLS
jgi:hypothetical protein